MTIESQLDLNEERIDAVMQSLNRRVSSLVSKLETDGDLIISDAVTIQRAENMRSEIVSLFGEYNEEVRRVTEEYDTVAQYVRESLESAGIPVEFTQVDADILQAFSDDAFNELIALGNQTATEIGSMVYTNAISGGKLSDTIEGVEQLLIGKTDKRGRPMANYAKTIANTKYMEIDATLTKKKAEEAGIDEFRYAGSLINDSRDWCVKHKDKVLTSAEIEGWADESWQGKSPGNPFSARGGYNCRHRWIPVVR